MQDRKLIQSYINNFRRHIVAFLRPGIGLACKVHPAKKEGAVLEFLIGPDVQNDDEYFPVEETVSAILRHVPQRMVGGNLDGIKFGGTNISMEPNRIVLIKGEDSDGLWNDDGAKHDVERIVQSFKTLQA
jgi:hypothetical protein